MELQKELELSKYVQFQWFGLVWWVKWIWVQVLENFVGLKIGVFYSFSLGSGRV